MQPQALIRTYVPVAVGSAIAALASHGIAVDSTSKAALVTGLTGLVIAAYYTLIHLLESRWPVFSVLLGSNATPSYAPSKAASDGPAALATPQSAATPEDLG